MKWIIRSLGRLISLLRWRRFGATASVRTEGNALLLDDPAALLARSGAELAEPDKQPEAAMVVVGPVCWLPWLPCSVVIGVGVTPSATRGVWLFSVLGPVEVAG